MYDRACIEHAVYLSLNYSAFNYQLSEVFNCVSVCNYSRPIMCACIG